MSDVVDLLSKFGPRCCFCGELATRITVSTWFHTLFEARCEDFCFLFQSTSIEVAGDLGRTWLRTLIENDLVRSGSADVEVYPLDWPRIRGWYYCDKHQSPASVGYQDLPIANLVRVEEGPPVERPTRFERILGPDV